MNIVNVGYKSTNYYVIADAQPRLLVDAGWPGTLAQFENACQRKGIALAKIPYVLPTHYHPDHAGLAQELKRNGSKLIVLDTQLEAIPLLSGMVKPDDHFVEIDLRDNVMLALDESRAFLKRIGIEGEIVATPGHSDDSVSLILDEGAAFTGDLTHPILVGDDTTTLASWDKLRGLGVKQVYPGHGPVWRLYDYPR